MATLKNIFDKCGVALYQNESLDLDHYYQEPYQDEGDEIKVIGEPFETDKSKKIRPYDLFAEDRTFSNFSFFMDGSRRTYKIGDIVIDGGKKIYPVVIAQIRAGCTERDGAKKLHSHQTILRKNLLLLSDKINTVDFKEIQQRLMRTAVAKEMFLEVVSYRFESEKHNIPVNAAIAKANSMMHDMEIEILSNMVKSGSLDTDRMLIVDGPLQFLRQDTGKAEFSDLFYNVIGVSKSFNPMLPASGKSKRGGTQIGAELLKLEYGERTPVFMKENDRGRRFGVWYLRIRPKNRVSNPLEGIIKIEKPSKPSVLLKSSQKTVMSIISKCGCLASLRNLDCLTKMTLFAIFLRRHQLILIVNNFLRHAKSGIISLKRAFRSPATKFSGAHVKSRFTNYIPVVCQRENRDALKQKTLFVMLNSSTKRHLTANRCI